MRKVFRNLQLGIAVEMDTREVYPKDPGMGTPVLVTFSTGDTGTWNCVTSEGETSDGYKLSKDQLNWLETVRPKVEEWMQENGV